MKWDVIQPLSSTLSHGLVWPVALDCKTRIKLSDRTTFVVRRLTFPCSDISDTIRCTVSFYLWCLYLPPYLCVSFPHPYLCVFSFISLRPFFLFRIVVCLFSSSLSLCIFCLPPHLCVSFSSSLSLSFFRPPYPCIFFHLFFPSLSLYVFSLPIFVVVSFLSIFVCLFSP